MHKNYLKAIEGYELRLGLLEYLVFFFNNDDEQVIQEICEGNVFLPTPKLLKNLLSYNSNVISFDEELSRLYENCITLSYKFYEYVIPAIIGARLDASKNFGTAPDLSKEYGQAFIVSLMQVKIRLGYLGINNLQTTAEQKYETYIRLEERARLYNNYTHKIIYLLKKMLAKAEIEVRVACIAMHIMLFCVIIYIDRAELISLASGIALIFTCYAFIINHPLHSFEHTDISGRNLIAYRYRLRVNRLLQQALRRRSAASNIPLENNIAKYHYPTEDPIYLSA
ncbi:MAG: hypothetical protein V4485_05620 [Pseudomonadota bacterium]